MEYITALLLTPNITFGNPIHFGYKTSQPFALRAEPGQFVGYYSEQHPGLITKEPELCLKGTLMEILQPLKPDSQVQCDCLVTNVDAEINAGNIFVNPNVYSSQLLNGEGKVVFDETHAAMERFREKKGPAYGVPTYSVTLSSSKTFVLVQAPDPRPRKPGVERLDIKLEVAA